MNEQEKQEYLEKYKEEKKKGIYFFPDAIFKDSLIVFLIFLALVALAYLLGAPLEERANPADASYTPKPEWYFLFLFQLLKYFPGELEVIGVVVLPTLAIVLLFLLPFLDGSPRRHFLSRPWVTGVTTLVVAGIIFLSVQSVIEAPPPAEAAEGDTTAALYTANCAGCHGPTISVPSDADLHQVIAQGGHEGMPAWSGDLTSDEIDALVGFILSPGGSEIFTANCSECHEATELVASDPLELKNALELGPGYRAHDGLDIPNWRDEITREERTALLNFLMAPDGRRLFVTNCSACHGRSVGYSGELEELQTIIEDGGLHLEMPPWRERLSGEEITTLARYVVDPGSDSGAEELFAANCARCHGDRVPAGDSVEEAEEVIATGGSHETMPVWGEILTGDQIVALAEYTLEAARGEPTALGAQLYADNCATCHGDLGEGGENPARPGDIIAPISSAEYLKTRDNLTLRSIIAQGQPNFGMSPFGSTYGGPLDEEEIDALVSYIRSWEEDPPVDLPPEVPERTVDLNAFDIFSEICSQCHGITGAGGIGPNLRAAEFRNNKSSQQIFDTINEGHEATDMIAWGAILNSEQIVQLVNFIEGLPIDEPTPEAEITPVQTPEAGPTAEPTPEPAAEISFSADVYPIFEFRCVDCHGTDGGWDASTYDLIINSGDHGPVVIPGDPESSLLAQKIRGTHVEGDLMPPPPLKALNDAQIQLIIEWIAAGAPNN